MTVPPRMTKRCEECGEKFEGTHRSRVCPNHECKLARRRRIYKGDAAQRAKAQDRARRFAQSDYGKARMKERWKVRKARGTLRWYHQPIDTLPQPLIDLRRAYYRYLTRTRRSDSINDKGKLDRIAKLFAQSRKIDEWSDDALQNVSNRLRSILYVG